MTCIHLIEDNIETCTLVQKVLLLAGYRMITSHDGEHALHLLENRLIPLPNLIILDVALPGMTGYEVARRIKKNPILRQIPVVFFSSRNRAELQEMVQEIGIEGIISKPFKVSEFLTKIENKLVADKSDLINC
ncbi:MAG: component of chemotactic signal transduction system [Promethearchaeota archaeon CR_4]|nr:MAG: component of chemotactic signal transduction system [Candidatus Lokiarchaeota archaeon CR_4]